MPIFDKEKRNERKSERKEKKDIKLGEEISSEAKSFGVDVDKPASTIPLGAGKKAEIDKRISDATRDDFKEGLKKFQQLQAGPNIATPEQLNKEKLKKDLRSQKRAKFGDILTGLGRGLQGKSIDPAMYQTSIKRKEREDQYNQFKDASKASQEKLKEWEAGYAQQQIDYLKTLSDNETSNLKKRKIEEEIKNLETKTQWQKNKPYYKPSSASAKEKTLYTSQDDQGNWNMTNQKNPYSDLYYKLTGNSQNIVNELAKQWGMPVDPKTNELKSSVNTYDIERFSNTLLSKAFDIKVDDNGNQIAIPKPGKENFLQELNSIISEKTRLQLVKDQLETQRESELYDVSGFNKDSKKERVNAKYDSLINKAETELQDADSKFKNMMDGTEAKSSTKEKSTSPQSELDSIYNS